MREYSFQIQPFSFLSLLDIKVDKRPNQHPTAVVSGYIGAEDNADVERCPAGQHFTISACGESCEDKAVFNGIVEHIEIAVENGLRRLTVFSIADTVHMDIDKHIRTFQDNSMTYAQVLSILEQGDGRFGFLSPGVGSQKIGRMLVQYEETDWEFCKRIASRLNTVVIPNSTLGMPYLSIGVTGSGQRHMVSSPGYSICKDLLNYMDSVKNGVRGISERDAVSYVFESREIYDLCDKITLDGRQLYVYSVQSRLEKAELIHTYNLREKSGFYSKEFFNGKIVGASLSGEVKSIQNAMVRASIHKDVKQSGYKWFSYATAYSSQDGTGWYFMPEIGDEIRLYFPTEHEEDAYVISSVHITHGERSDPDIKFIRTKQGKEIVFNPSSIYITNGAGSSITLSDDKGIEIETSKKMNLTASENISISGGGKVIVRGSKGVDVEQNDSTIHIAENIEIASGHTRMR